MPARRLAFRRSELTYDWLSAAGNACQSLPGLTVMNPTNSGSPAATAPQSGGQCGTPSLLPAAGAGAVPDVPAEPSVPAVVDGAAVAGVAVAVRTSSESMVPVTHTRATIRAVDRARSDRRRRPVRSAPRLPEIAVICLTLSPLRRQNRSHHSNRTHQVEDPKLLCSRPGRQLRRRAVRSGPSKLFWGRKLVSRRR